MTWSLRKLLNHASEMAETFVSKVEDDGDSAMPHFVAEQDDKVTLVACPWTDGRDRELLCARVRFMLAAHGHPQWVLFHEVWRAVYDSADEQRRIQPKDHPNRQEIYLFEAENVPRNQKIIATRQIIRVEGQPPRLMPLVIEQRIPLTKAA